MGAYCCDGSVLKITGKISCEPFTASTPSTCGSALNKALNCSLFRTSIAICFSSAVTSSGFAEKSTLMGMVAIEKSELMFPTVVICELGTT